MSITYGIKKQESNKLDCNKCFLKHERLCKEKANHENDYYCIQLIEIWRNNEFLEINKNISDKKEAETMKINHDHEENMQN